MTSLIPRILAVATALLLCGCANIRSPIKAVADKRVPIAKESKLAFYLEPDIRIEKRLLYERAGGYLRKAGFNIVDPDSADFVVRLMITLQQVTSLEVELPSSPVGSAEATPTRKDGASFFHFMVYPAMVPSGSTPQAVWEVSIVANQAEFRANEEEFIQRIFEHLGKSHIGTLQFPAKG